MSDPAEAPDLYRRSKPDARTLIHRVLPLTVTAWETSVKTLESINAGVDLSHVPGDDTKPTERSIARLSWHPAEVQILGVVERSFENGTTEALRTALREYGAPLLLTLVALTISWETKEVQLTDRDGTPGEKEWYRRYAYWGFIYPPRGRQRSDGDCTSRRPIFSCLTVVHS